MDSGSGLIRLALFGMPVGHSLSPLIHSLFAEQAGLSVEYLAHETNPGTLQNALANFRSQGGIGCNITLPLKQEAMAASIHCSSRVKRAGAANTLSWQESGWHADNTDGAGLVKDLQRLGLSSVAKRIAILGAGGAAAGILSALLEAGPQQLDIYNRTTSTALTLAQSHSDLGPVKALALDAMATSKPYDLVINATSLGHQSQIPELTPSLFNPGACCYDLNYGPASRPLRSWCKHNDILYQDGLGMLVAQAAESFRCWTSFKPDAGPVLYTLRNHP